VLTRILAHSGGKFGVHLSHAPGSFAQAFTIGIFADAFEDQTHPARKPIEIDRREPSAGDARRTGADTSRAREDLGYAPSVDLREGLSRQIAHARGGAG